MRTRRASYPSPCDGITFFIKPKQQHFPAAKRRKLNNTCEPSIGPPHALQFHPPSSSSSSSSSFSSSLSISSPFDSIHDEILVSIMAALSASASCPADLVNAMLTCKRFCAAAANPLVLRNAGLASLAVKASAWSDGAHRFLRQCAASGNAEAAYTLGMIRFYCLREREAGASLMAQAAVARHASALHSLAIIQFNGSGGGRKEKNLKNGASLCAKAASLGHVDAMRELGHCLQDGYGVPKNVPEGRKLLLEANAREAAAAMVASSSSSSSSSSSAASSSSSPSPASSTMGISSANSCSSNLLSFDSSSSSRSILSPCSAAAASAISESGPGSNLQSGGSDGGGGGGGTTTGGRLSAAALATAGKLSRCHLHYRATILSKLRLGLGLGLGLGALGLGLGLGLGFPGPALLSDFGCTVPPPRVHVANQFLVDWFAAAAEPSTGLRMCSHGSCGRPETRRHEFRRCSACGTVNYCSRACQALHWKLRHKFDCTPVAAAAHWHAHHHQHHPPVAGAGHNLELNLNLPAADANHHYHHHHQHHHHHNHPHDHHHHHHHHPPHHHT